MIRQRKYTKSLSLNIIFVYSFQCELYFFKVKEFIDLRVKPRGIAKNLRRADCFVSMLYDANRAQKYLLPIRLIACSCIDMHAFT